MKVYWSQDISIDRCNPCPKGYGYGAPSGPSGPYGPRSRGGHKERSHEPKYGGGGGIVGGGEGSGFGGHHNGGHKNDGSRGNW
jgi:hypothetical protein